MKRYGLPTALCPKCQDFAFRMYKEHIKDNSHQCCNCQQIFNPKKEIKLNTNKGQLYVAKGRRSYGEYINR